MTLKSIKDRLDNIKTEEGEINDGRYYIYKDGTKYTPAFYYRRLDHRDGVKEEIQFLNPRSKAQAVQAYYDMVNFNRYPLDKEDWSNYDKSHPPKKGQEPTSQVPAIMTDEMIEKQYENAARFAAIAQKIKPTHDVVSTGPARTVDTGMVRRIRPAMRRPSI